MTCPFCEIIAGRAPQPAHYEPVGQRMVCFQPLSPHGEGHRLFVPIEHIENASADPWYAGQLVVAATYWAGRNDVAEYNIITSTGRSATQTVPHLHVHLVPRAPADRMIIPWGKLAQDHRPKEQPQ